MKCFNGLFYDYLVSKMHSESSDDEPGTKRKRGVVNEDTFYRYLPVQFTKTYFYKYMVFLQIELQGYAAY